MKSIFLVAFLYLEVLVVNLKSEYIHTRRKRYLVFPEGSSFAVVYGVGNRSPLMSGIWDQGLNYGIAYDLPNETYAFKTDLSPRHLIQRRHRRDLYNKIEIILNSLGFDGRSCMYRALCESSQILQSKSNNIFEKILETVFSFPQQKLLKSEPDDNRLYHWAYRKGKEIQNKSCAQMFHTCSISLLDMALNFLDFD